MSDKQMFQAWNENSKNSKNQTTFAVNHDVMDKKVIEMADENISTPQIKRVIEILSTQ